MLGVGELTAAYGAEPVLKQVSLQVRRGELVALLGANGAGKSTLMRSIATLQTPTSGSIRFGDIDVIRTPEQLRRVLGYLPQDFGVYPRVSAYDMLNHMAVLKGIANGKERKDTVEALLNQVNLWPVRGKALAGFSGGMRQRFGIAQALIGNPELIIVDEPTAGLDPEERNRFLNLLAEVGENVVVILSTHIVEDVTDLCPRMAVLAGGKVQLEGTPAELMHNLEGRVWRRAIDKAELAEFRTRYNVISTRLLGGRTIVHVVSDKNPGDGFERAPGGLEDVYLATVAQSRRAAA
ncbi:MAG: ABC transporter ATP-binding protein [Brevundimonas sp.]|uniref:ABC transporter ATP-binding protein n=1 Tax=Brevundimonas sp. TaxID=1871086 RepID=UPI004034BD5C